MFGSKDKDEELKALREEIEQLKNDLKNLSEHIREETRGEREEKPPRSDRGYALKVDVGERISDYVNSIVDSVMRGIVGELDRSVLITGRAIKGLDKHLLREPVKVDPKKAAEIMSALGHDNRIRILEELSAGGLYASELQERLPDIGASTLSSHLDVLEKAGLIVQEKARGRYLITIPGRLAYRMANHIAKQIDESFL